MCKFYVYQLRRSDDFLPFYIGKGTGQRAKKHLCGNEGNNSLKNNIINKAKREGIEILVEFIGVNLSECEAFKLEITTILKYGRRDLNSGCLANMTNGGEGISGHRHKESTKLKQSLSHLNLTPDEKMLRSLKLSEAHKNMSIETRALKSERITKALKNKPQSKEVVAARSEAARLRGLSEANKLALYNSKKGKPQTEEHKMAISNALKGKKKTPEHVKNASEAYKLSRLKTQSTESKS